MPGRGRPRADARKRKRETVANEAKRAKTTTTEQPDRRQEARQEEPPAVERITLSLDDGPSAAQGNAFRPPMVEEIFNISTILNEPVVPKETATSDTSFSLQFGDDEPPAMIKCAEDDLSAHVPHQLKQKIWENKYINIALLLKGNAELADIFSGGLLHVSADGKVEAKPRQTKEKVANIEQWTEAFLIFTSVYLVRFPDKAQELLKYIAVIRDAASKYPNLSWRLYDEQFRIRQAITVSEWGKINPDLWLRTMPAATSVATTSVQSATQFGSCRGFNRGFCSFIRCRYRHVCDLCGSSSHGMIRCQVGKTQGGGQSDFTFRGFRPTRFSRFSRGFQGRGRGFQSNK